MDIDLEQFKARIATQEMPTEVNLTMAARFIMYSAQDVPAAGIQFATVMLAWMCGVKSDDMEDCSRMVGMLAMQEQHVIAEVRP